MSELASDLVRSVDGELAQRQAPSDNLAEQRAKLDEYIARGARLGWLIERRARQLAAHTRKRIAGLLPAPASEAAP